LKNTIAIILAVFVLVVSFLSFTNTPFISKTFNGIKGGLSVTVGPALKTISKPVDGISGLLNTYVNLIGAKKENEELKKQVDTLRMENHRLQELEKEHKRFKDLLGFMEKKPSIKGKTRVCG